MITYKTVKRIAPQKLYDLYESVHWAKEVKNNKKHGKYLSNVYAHSDGVVSAWDGKMLVGVIRFLTDKYAHEVLYELAVHPDYQGRGIGSELLKKCLKTNTKIEWSGEAERKV